MKGGELWLINSNIPEYREANRFNHEPKRPRKLLLHKSEINKLSSGVLKEHLTIIPLKMFFNPRGRVKVDTRCQIPGLDSIYVLGDLAAFSTDDGSTLPGVAPVAMQQGEWVGRRIARSLSGRALEKRFRYRDRGSMATIGRSQAIVQIGWLQLSGRIAWLLWLFVHILNLAKFENRVLVLIQWFWNYVTRNRSARLITGATSPDVPKRLS